LRASAANEFEQYPTIVVNFNDRGTEPNYYDVGQLVPDGVLTESDCLGYFRKISPLRGERPLLLLCGSGSSELRLKFNEIRRLQVEKNKQKAIEAVRKKQAEVDRF
jgi:hypothetical protein